ncbi:MAG: hypothetical protein WA901_11430 [Phormidesmis sp.]
MTTTNNDSSNQEVPSNQEISGVHGRPATPEELARRDGYVKGRNDENYAQGTIRTHERVAAQAQANDSAASGLLIGLLVALVAAGAGAALYFLTGDRTNTVPVAVPQIEKETTKETTVIEREVPSSDVSLPDVQINVPDVNVPAIDAPDVNITNEAPEPAAAPAAELAPEPKAESAPEQPVEESSAE